MEFVLKSCKLTNSKKCEMSFLMKNKLGRVETNRLTLWFLFEGNKNFLFDFFILFMHSF